MVGWSWWDWSLILRTIFCQCFGPVGGVNWLLKTMHAARWKCFCNSETHNFTVLHDNKFFVICINFEPLEQLKYKMPWTSTALTSVCCCIIDSTLLTLFAFTALNHEFTSGLSSHRSTSSCVTCHNNNIIIKAARAMSEDLNVLLVSFCK